MPSCRLRHPDNIQIPFPKWTWLFAVLSHTSRQRSNKYQSDSFLRTMRAGKTWEAFIMHIKWSFHYEGEAMYSIISGVQLALTIWKPVGSHLQCNRGRTSSHIKWSKSQHFLLCTRTGIAAISGCDKHTWKESYFPHSALFMMESRVVWRWFLWYVI